MPRVRLVLVALVLVLAAIDPGAAEAGRKFARTDRAIAMTAKGPVYRGKVRFGGLVARMLGRGRTVATVEVDAAGVRTTASTDRGGMARTQTVERRGGGVAAIDTGATTIAQPSAQWFVGEGGVVKGRHDRREQVKIDETIVARPGALAVTTRTKRFPGGTMGRTKITTTTVQADGRYTRTVAKESAAGVPYGKVKVTTGRLAVGESR